MKDVFIDTSGFYAVLDARDPFHPDAKAAFLRAEEERWNLWTTNYVVHESWALIQHRLGWAAVEDFLDILLPHCRIEIVTESLHAAGARRCRAARERRLSLTDCVSFEFIEAHGLRQAIAKDDHFARERIEMP